MAKNTLENVLTQKQQDFVLNLSKEIKTQDNLATASPYIIINTQNRIQVRPDTHADEYILYLDFETKIHNNDELIELVKHDYPNLCKWLEDNLEEPKDMLDLEFMASENEARDEYKAFKDEFSDMDIVYYEEELEASKHDLNVFFTHKAYKEHIEANSHRYNEPKSWLKGLFRNPEMEGVLDVVHSLAHAIELERETVCFYTPYEHTNKLYVTGCDHTLVNPAYSTIWDFCPSCGRKISLRKEQK